MRKRIIIIGVIVLLVGVVIMAHGINNAGNVVEETYSSMDPGEAYEYFHKMASGKKDPAPPLIDPAIILGAAVSVFGVIFLAKSKDEKFLPGI